MIQRLGMAICWASMTFACGDSTCEIAQDRLKECSAEAQAKVASFQRLPLDLSSCDGAANACVASCVASSTCPAINYVLLAQNTDPNASIPEGAGELGGCLNHCLDIATAARAGAPSQ